MGIDSLVSRHVSDFNAVVHIMPVLGNESVQEIVDIREQKRFSFNNFYCACGVCGEYMNNARALLILNELFEQIVQGRELFFRPYDNLFSIHE